MSCAEVRNNKWNCEGNTCKCFSWSKCKGCGCKGNTYQPPKKPKVKVTRRNLKRPKNT